MNWQFFCGVLLGISNGVFMPGEVLGPAGVHKTT